MQWLALYFPCLHLDSLCQASESESDQTDAKVVIDSSHRVLQLNTLALEQGIETGMRLGTATAMVDALSFFEWNPAFECKKLHELALQCYALSSDVVVRETSRCLLIEFSGMLKLHANEQAFLRCVLNMLRLHEVSLQYGVADAPLLAELLARHQPLLPEPCLRVEDAHTRLAQLPTQCLDLPAKIIQKFERLGLPLIRDVLRLPDAELAMRLGEETLAYLHSLQSGERTVLPRFKPPEHFSVSVNFDAEVYASSALLFPARRLLEQLEHFLRQRCQHVQTMEWLLFSRTRAIQRIRIVSAQPEVDAQTWHDLLRLKCDYLELSAPVLGMELYVETLLSLEVEAQDLFDTGVSGKSVASTLSRLEARLGAERILQPVLEPSFVPEQSIRYLPIQDLKQQRRQWAVSEPARQYGESSLRPSLLLNPPEALSETVRIVHGPERIQTAWWEEDPVERDYFVAVNDQKQLLWIFRDTQQQWFVHGLFA